MNHLFVLLELGHCVHDFDELGKANASFLNFIELTHNIIKGIFISFVPEAREKQLDLVGREDAILVVVLHIEDFFEVNYIHLIQCLSDVFARLEALHLILIVEDSLNLGLVGVFGYIVGC